MACYIYDNMYKIFINMEKPYTDADIVMAFINGIGVTIILFICILSCQIPCRGDKNYNKFIKKKDKEFDKYMKKTDKEFDKYMRKLYNPKPKWYKHPIKYFKYKFE